MVPCNINITTEVPYAISHQSGSHEPGICIINDRKTEEIQATAMQQTIPGNGRSNVLGRASRLRLRIERRCELGYPAAEWGATAVSVDDGLLALNGEIISAAADPASSNDVEHFYTAVLTTWIFD